MSAVAERTVETDFWQCTGMTRLDCYTCLTDTNYASHVTGVANHWMATTSVHSCDARHVYVASRTSMTMTRQ
jgi:hypothetical protein